MAVVVCVNIVILFIVLCAFTLDLTKGEELRELHPARDFTRHTIIKPKIYHGREKRQISTTREEDGKHTYHLLIDYELDGDAFSLDLQLNKDLIPKGYFSKYQKDGIYVVNKPSLEEVDMCHYQGKLRGVDNSWAAISTCGNKISGVIYDGKEMHYIEKGSLSDEHYLYKHSDLDKIVNNKTCGYVGDVNHDKDHGEDDLDILDFHEITDKQNRILRYKRSTNPQIRGPYNANKQSRYVELVLVADNREYKELGENINRVEEHCKNIANIINALYAPLNIFIALVGVVTWTDYDEIEFSVNGDMTLTNFLHYRREKLIQKHPNDNAQLLTKFSFDNGVVGKALKGPICTYEYSGGVNTDHSSVIGLVATTVAHEMGHNFGMEHDSNDCSCPEDRCIMAPSSSTDPPTHWSSCSLESLALAFEHGMDYCLRNKPESLFGGPLCGNGFVEPGEQCDCGLPEHCDNYCCNASTCMLHTNASCATGECCDLNTCHPKKAGTLCRSADYECDLPEYCTGQSEYCPNDIYKLDTQSCDDGKAFCFHGFCRTRTDQCKLLWGNTGKSSHEQCYKMNTKGSRHGNCGFNKLNQSYFKCQDENVLCGMLHCRHLNERLEFGMESVSILSHSFINWKGAIIPCRTALVDLGINQIDPGLAPDGAKCGDGKMCVNQKCMSVASLRKQGPTCPHDCNGNGVCNSLGHCHCKDGFAPPYCDYPGPGGSEDSGPASDPDARREIINAIYIIFLGVLPVLAIIGYLTFYARHNLKFSWQKSPSIASVKSPPKARGTATFNQENAKRTEDNHSLLADEHNVQHGMQNELFGQFKGFTISPIKKQQQSKQPEIVRPAPAVPTPPVVPSTRQSLSPIVSLHPPATTKPTTSTQQTINAPKLPPTSTIPTTSKLGTTLSSSATSRQVNSPNLQRSITTVGQQNKNHTLKPNSLTSAVDIINNTAIAQALPPLNPGSTARPIISSPILENSTCTAKELLSPLRNAPKIPLRSAQDTPQLKQKETSDKDCADNVEEKKPKEMSTINRIASFLKSHDKKPQINSTNSLPRNSHKLNKIDKNSLRSMEISKPIPQNDIEVAGNALPVDSIDAKNVVMRAQSMRGTNVTNKPNIQSFGSMRQPNGLKRPISIPSGNRPKSPPPPRPPVPKTETTEPKVIFKVPTLPGYQPPTSKNKQNQYDDCLNEALANKSTPSSDNIYAVIEETPINSPEANTTHTTSSGSSESVGLLGEIVSEIQNRNLESIYSTNTVSRKKENNKNNGDNDLYVNTSNIYKTPESEYSNASNISSTSSGYITPAAVNLPLKQVNNADKIKAALDKRVVGDKKVEDDKRLVDQMAVAVGKMGKVEKDDKVEKVESAPKMNTFKTDRGSVKLKNASSRTQGSLNGNRRSIGDSNAILQNPSPSSKGTMLNRQTTPPNLRTRKPSPTRTTGVNTAKLTTTPQQKPTTNKQNSPDLVTSCANSKTTLTKPPDVLNVKKTTSVPVKPTLPKTMPKLAVKTNASFISVKQPNVVVVVDKKSDNKPPIATKSINNKTTSDVSGGGTSSNKTLSTGAKIASKQNSNVAALQQKFENKQPISVKSSAKK